MVLREYSIFTPLKDSKSYKKRGLHHIKGKPKYYLRTLTLIQNIVESLFDLGIGDSLLELITVGFSILFVCFVFGVLIGCAESLLSTLWRERERERESYKINFRCLIGDILFSSFDSIIWSFQKKKKNYSPNNSIDNYNNIERTKLKYSTLGTVP